ncbi:MAG: Response regulator [Bacteroidetes bacterium]|jgi:two-component system, LytTR family, response regulator LytT|nr:Response regulator [Bacteroidota bacterium]
MLKIIIIEDEKRIAQELKSIVCEMDDEIEIVAMISSVSEADEFFASMTKCDLIFSDIQLTDGLSFDIFKKATIAAPVIFCTAYDQYALEAFKTNSIDYILKPFDKESVAKALKKYYLLKSQFSSHQANMVNLLQSFESQLQKTAATSSIIINKGDKIIPIKLQDIALFYCEDEYVYALSFDLQKNIVSQSLDELEKMCGAAFFRANRQHLVSRKSIKDVSRYFNRKLLLNLEINYPAQIAVSRLKAHSLIEWLSQI